MPTITFALTDEDVERIANRVAEKLATSWNQSQPEFNSTLPDKRLQVSRVEAARRLGCNPVTLDRLAKRGLIRPNRATRCPMYPMKELERFVAECSETIGP